MHVLCYNRFVFCVSPQLHCKSEQIVWNQWQQSEALHQPQKSVSIPRRVLRHVSWTHSFGLCFLTTLPFNAQQDGDEDEADVHIVGRLLQQHQAPICVRERFKRPLWLVHSDTRLQNFLQSLIASDSHFRNLRDNNLSTLSWRTFQNFNSTLP